MSKIKVMAVLLFNTIKQPRVRRNEKEGTEAWLVRNKILSENWENWIGFIASI